MQTIKRYLNVVMSEDWLKSALVLALLVIGCVALFYGARMSYKFGETMSHEHGVTLMLVALFAAIIFPASHLLKKNGWDSAGKWARGIGVFCLAVELVTHMGYTFGQRHENVTKALHQTVAYQEQQEALEEAKRSRAMFERRLGELIQANGWSATVTADGLRADLANMEGDQIFRRSRQCADVTRPDSRAFCDRRAQIQSRIAIVEERSKLQEQIEATKRVLDRQRDKTASTDLGNSAVVEQSRSFAKLLTMNLRPDADSTDWVKIILGVMLAIVTVLLAPASLETAFKIAGMAGIGAPSARHVPPIEARFAPPPPPPSADNSDVFHAIRNSIKGSGLKVAS